MTSGNSNSIKGSLCWITDVPLLQWSGHCNLFLWVDMIFHLINDTQTPNCQKKNTLRKVYANVTEPQNTFLVGLANSKKHGPFSKQNTPINTAVTALNRLTDCSCLFLFFFYPKESPSSTVYSMCLYVADVPSTNQFRSNVHFHIYAVMQKSFRTSWRKLPQLSEALNHKSVTHRFSACWDSCRDKTREGCRCRWFMKTSPFLITIMLKSVIRASRWECNWFVTGRKSVASEHRVSKLDFLC